MINFILTALLLALISFSALGSELNPESLAKEYYQSKIQDNDPCRPTGSCFQTACETVGRFECDDFNEQQTLRNACKGVYGNGCLLESFKFLGKFEYDDLEEMARLVTSCRGVFDIQCVNYSCTRLGRFGCDELEEIARVNQACSRNYP